MGFSSSSEPKARKNEHPNFPEGQMLLPVCQRRRTSSRIILLFSISQAFTQHGAKECKLCEVKCKHTMVWLESLHLK